ncbi:hypothetical protein EVAR_16302_1 [Eumeta japonica]|uniref:Uncharacterized protein n=1 Tax=Eumeta variegata TaxID=151549 RepID=A0A4C1VGG2_EUMVA|nr:hypothetical protein EVAR_16302_1 [Eumeta japonica]
MDGETSNLPLVAVIEENVLPVAIYESENFQNSCSSPVVVANGVGDKSAARGRPIIVEWERRKAFGGPLSFGDSSLRYRALHFSKLPAAT